MVQAPNPIQPRLPCHVESLQVFTQLRKPDPMPSAGSGSPAFSRTARSGSRRHRRSSPTYGSACCSDEPCRYRNSLEEPPQNSRNKPRQHSRICALRIGHVTVILSQNCLTLKPPDQPRTTQPQEQS
jgi:hypothetical protein